MKDVSTGRYEVRFYYTHIMPNLIKHQVKYYLSTYDTVKEALKKARKLADVKKGIYTTTVIDTQTGEIVYQKIEMNNMGSGLFMYDE